MPIVHPDRVASDGALAIVRAAASPQYHSFASLLLDNLGSELYGFFADTRNRLLTALVETGSDGAAGDAEAGKWRSRLEDLLRGRPELADTVLRLTVDAGDLQTH